MGPPLNWSPMCEPGPWGLRGPIMKGSPGWDMGGAWCAPIRLLRVEDWARDRDPTDVTEEVGLWWWARRWEWLELSLLDLKEPYSGGGW